MVDRPRRRQAQRNQLSGDLGTAELTMYLVLYLEPEEALAILSLLMLSLPPALKLLPPEDPATNLDACCTTRRQRYRADRAGGHLTRKGNPNKSFTEVQYARKGERGGGRGGVKEREGETIGDNRLATWTRGTKMEKYSRPDKQTVCHVWYFLL